jgi:hypothetical protein
MARFVTGGEHPQARKGGKQGGFTRTLVWKEGETKYVQFVTPLDMVRLVLMHQFIKVGKTKDGADRFMEFVSRTDIQFEGDPNFGYDPLIERFGLDPKLRTLAIAVEMDPITERVSNRNKVVGFRPTTRTFERKDGTEVTVIDQKLVNQTEFTFFSTLRELDDDRPFNNYVWKVKRTGSSKDTRYTFLDAGPAVDLEISDDERFDLDKYIEELASVERMKVIEQLPANARISRYGQAAPTGDAPAAAAEEAPAEDAPSDRESRFNAFKDALNQ